MTVSNLSQETQSNVSRNVDIWNKLNLACICTIYLRWLQLSWIILGGYSMMFAHLAYFTFISSLWHWHTAVVVRHEKYMWHVCIERLCQYFTRTEGAVRIIRHGCVPQWAKTNEPQTIEHCVDPMRNRLPAATSNKGEELDEWNCQTYSLSGILKLTWTKFPLSRSRRSTHPPIENISMQNYTHIRDCIQLISRNTV